MTVASRRVARGVLSRPSGWARRRSLLGMLYAVPTAIFVALFFLLPLLLVAQMSASDWRLLTGDQGLNFPANYEGLDANPLFWPAVEFTIRYTVIVTVLLIGLGLLLALIVQESSRWSGLLRTTFLMPLAVGLAAASLLFWGFYSPQIGPLNPLLQELGLIREPILFFASHTNALMATVFLIVWKFAGLYMLILLVGLQSIPTELYEAAAIDGAGRWQTFRRITLPLLRPSLALSLILSVTGSLLAFDQFFLLTKGGPGNSTVTIVQLIYQQAFVRQNLGIAAALSIVLLIALLILNIIWFRLLRRGAGTE
ncbi:MAG: sugar ABC transporter permease [Chloroflexota bacterium]|nr:sugar ABC transporter permease [Chloroflexota bacterium]